jgi:hypothetical protein
MPSSDALLSSGPPSTTVVTSFWLVKGSKHRPEEYKAWISTFFRSVTGNTVLFTSRSSLALIQDAIPAHRENLLINVDYDEPFDIPCIKKYKDLYQRSQWLKDPEKKIHSPELYAVWNGKTCIVERIVRENPFSSGYFLWVDVGSFRDESWIPQSVWPDSARVHALFSNTSREVLVSAFDALQPSVVQKLTAQDDKWRSGKNFLFDDKSFFVQGGIFGGRAEALYDFFKYFWKVHDQFVQEGRFVGKDQLLFTHAAAFHKPRPLIIMSYKAHPTCGNIWFYFQQFLASDTDLKPGCKLVQLLNIDQFLAEFVKPEIV